MTNISHWLKNNPSDPFYAYVISLFTQVYSPLFGTVCTDTAFSGYGRFEVCTGLAEHSHSGLRMAG